ncbi:MAG TPA: hypothetical protein VKZ63_17955, partial [Kofleriaceae bacterium]|nr:hypothetical protein [Kofleriaceae bacterium]
MLHRDRRDRHRGIVPPPPARDERWPGRRLTAAARPAKLDGDAEVGETVTATSAQGGRALRRPARPWWSRLLAWLRSLLAAPRLALAAPPLERRWGAGAAALPGDLRDELARLDLERGAVRDAVTRAVEDHAHLREVLLAPGGAGAPVDEASLLAEAEITLRSIVARAPAVARLARIAAARALDRSGRQATGDALLHLRDQARAL